MNILHLTLKKKWFDEIKSGVKNEEYREDKPYWRNRLMENGKVKRFDAVIFRNGYGKNAPTMTVECKNIFLGFTPEWFGHGAPGKICWVIYLGKILGAKP